MEVAGLELLSLLRRHPAVGKDRYLLAGATQIELGLSLFLILTALILIVLS